MNCSLKGVVNGCSVMSQRRDVAEDGFETLGVHCISLIIIPWCLHAAVDVKNPACEFTRDIKNPTYSGINLRLQYTNWCRISINSIPEGGWWVYLQYINTFHRGQVKVGSWLGFLFGLNVYPGGHRCRKMSSYLMNPRYANRTHWCGRGRNKHCKDCPILSGTYVCIPQGQNGQG